MDGFNNGTRTITEDSLYRNDIGGTMAVAPQAALSGTERPSMPPAETHETWLQSSVQTHERAK